MGIRLFVGNLSFSLGDGDLREAFAEIGGVERAEIVRDRFDGRSRGFGFVEMSNEDEAAVALRAMNGKELAGRPLRVEAATSHRTAIRPQRGAGVVKRRRASDDQAIQDELTHRSGQPIRFCAAIEPKVARESVRMARAAESMACQESIVASFGEGFAC